MADKYANKAKNARKQRMQEQRAVRDTYTKRRTGCYNSFGVLKRGFPSLEEALDSKGAHDGLRPYECNLCHQWHLTKKTRAPHE